MIETLHSRLLAYLAKLNPRKNSSEVAGEIGIVLAKEIDKHTARLSAIELAIKKLQGEPDV